MDEYQLKTGDIEVGDRLHGGILSGVLKTEHGSENILIKDAANRKNDSARQCVPNDTDIEREYAAYRLSVIVSGLVNIPKMAIRTLTVDHTPTKVLVMEYAPGHHEPFSWGRTGTPKLQKYGIKLAEQRNASLFDSIVGNTDRHEQNYLIDTRGQKLWLIDHGLCFPDPTTSTYVDCGSTVFMRDYEALPKWAMGWLRKFQAKREKIERELKPLIGQEALDECFLRIEYMLKKERFLSQRELRNRTYA